MHIKPENRTPESIAAFAEIGKLMTAWAERFIARTARHNQQIKEKILPLKRMAPFCRSDTQNKELQQLERQLGSDHSIPKLAASIPGAKLAFTGSPKMDTGAAFMLLATYADLGLQEEHHVSDALIALVIAARGDEHLAAQKKTGQRPT